MDMPDRERNTAATFAETGTARHNLSMLLRKSSARRYAEIARITGHDKSWVSRFLSGSARASLPELLRWLDACDLHLAHGDPNSHCSTLHEHLHTVTQGIDTLRASGKLGDDQHDALMYALIQLARLGLETLANDFPPPLPPELGDSSAHPGDE